MKQRKCSAERFSASILPQAVTGRHPTKKACSLLKLGCPAESIEQEILYKDDVGMDR